MSLQLTDAERARVEQYLPLVTRVIKDRVHNPNQCGMYSYDDLVQIGCVGLCKAATSYVEGPQATFKTYAYRLIRNEIFNELEYATLRKDREVYMDQELLPDERYDDVRLGDSLDSLLDAAAKNASGITAKGIEALRLQAQGYSCKEIGKRFDDASGNNVSAWISRARKYLRQDPAIAAFAL
ncbi:MAG: sigma-70 family RNA polymerase sigma factor [Firmicutes bacterium]|nr:sigma-70 family RNA polymerase sigma factor [Bacillota bacterium]